MGTDDEQGVSWNINMRISRYFFPKDQNGKENEGDYLSVDLLNTIRDISLSLFRGLNFDDNFNSFEETVTIGTGEEVTIFNKLRIVPNEWVVVDARNGGPLIRGEKEWTASDISLANLGNAGVFKVRFFFTGLRD